MYLFFFIVFIVLALVLVPWYASKICTRYYWNSLKDKILYAMEIVLVVEGIICLLGGMFLAAFTF